MSAAPQSAFTGYNAEISAGSLMPLESRRVAELMLSQPDEPAWIEAIEKQNILQKRTPATARRQATLIRKRLKTLNSHAWQMIASRESEVSNQLLLAAAVKHSQLFGDFIRNVYALRQRKLEVALSVNDWQDFLTECAHHDSAVAGWSDSTKLKLFQVVIRMLVEAKFLDNSRAMHLTPPSLHPDVRRYLHQHYETYALDCLERTQ